MLRHLIPRFEVGYWSGGALTWSDDQQDDTRGFSIVIQWLGLLVEIGAGRVQ